MPCCDVAREALAAAERARRAEAEVERLHNWADDGCPEPRPRRPHWAPRTPHHDDDPAYSQPEER